MAFWNAMSPSEQDTFETEALENTDTMKKRLYLEASGKGGKAFDIYRQMVLKDQFERTHGLGPSVKGTTSPGCSRSSTDFFKPSRCRCSSARHCHAEFVTGIETFLNCTTRHIPTARFNKTSNVPLAQIKGTKLAMELQSIDDVC